MSGRLAARPRRIDGGAILVVLSFDLRDECWRELAVVVVDWRRRRRRRRNSGRGTNHQIVAVVIFGCRWRARRRFFDGAAPGVLCRLYSAICRRCSAIRFVVIVVVVADFARCWRFCARCWRRLSGELKRRALSKCVDKSCVCKRKIERQIEGAQNVSRRWRRVCARVGATCAENDRRIRAPTVGGLRDEHRALVERRVGGRVCGRIVACIEANENAGVRDDRNGEICCLAEQFVFYVGGARAKRVQLADDRRFARWRWQSKDALRKKKLVCTRRTRKNERIKEA